jgi:hypothetical protein
MKEGQARPEEENSTDYRLFESHHGTQQADVEDVVLCLTVKVT